MEISTAQNRKNRSWGISGSTEPSSLPDLDCCHGNIGCDSEDQFSFGSFKIIADKKKVETHERQVDDGFLKKF
jgi:hypothetical protein